MPGFRFLRESVIAFGWASHLSHRDLRILLAMRSVRLLAAAIVLGALFQPAAVAITINMSYSTDFGGDESPPWDANGAILKAHFQAAKQIWEALLPGPGSYEFDFQWDNDIGKDALGLTTDLGPIDVFIEINPNFNWFADPTPADDSEFDVSNGQTLFSQLSASNQATYFPGTPPPGALEVGFRGTGSPAILSASNQSGINANNGYDLLSTIVHEFGHVLGIYGEEPGEFNIDPQHVGGLVNVLVAEDEGGGHLAGHGAVPFLMCESCGPIGVRRFPTATDVLVIAEDQGISDVRLQRIGSISSGSWGDSPKWIGGDVPDRTQDAYIRHGGDTYLGADAEVRNLVVADGSSLTLYNHRLTVDGGLNFQGGSVSLIAGGTLAADSISGDPTSLTTAAGSLIRFNQFTRSATSTATSINFNGSVAIGYRKFNNTLSPVFDPSLISDWTIAEQLTVGDETNATLAINGGAHFTSTSGRIGTSQVLGGGNVNVYQSGSSWTIGGALDARQGALNIYDAGFMQSGSATIGVASSFMTATVNNASWIVNGSIDVGPPTATGTGSGTLNIQNGGQVNVTGNLKIHGSSGSYVSEVALDTGGQLIIDGEILVAPYGKLSFGQNTTASNDTITNLGNGETYRLGGNTEFTGNATAQSARITNKGGTAIWGYGGQTTFSGNSTAAFAQISNEGPSGQYAFVGTTVFKGAASAGNATITNQPTDGGRTTTDFYETSTAANARIKNKAGSYPTLAGITTFHDSATAGTGVFTNDGGDGQFNFKNSSTAGQASFSNGYAGGTIAFFNDSTAGQATLELRGKENSRVQFWDASSAGSSNIDVGGLVLGPTNEFNDVQFYQQSNAANATITVRGDGGRVWFAGATAGNATINLLGSTRPGNVPGTVAGQAVFDSLGTAGNAIVTAQPSTVVGAPGGAIDFINAGDAGSATLIANGGASAVNGGHIRFGGGSTGGSARIIVNAGANADFSLNGFGSYTGTAVGSIEGDGSFFLGNSLLTVGNRNTNTTVSGTIADIGGYYTSTGGQLSKVGSGTLTLDGANTYTGLTTVAQGALVVNGSIAGSALVKNGATLKGTGTMGSVVVEAGGELSPGLSPGTITVGGLNLMSGSKLKYELGAARDHILVTNNGNVTLGGTLDLAILTGFDPQPGQTFDLFEGAIGSVMGLFTTVNAPIFNGHTLDLVYTANHVTLRVIDAVLPPGDYNNNGIVDAADYVLWRKNVGTTTALPNDLIGGTIGTAQYNQWRTNFGQTAPGAGSSSGAIANATVPEPATCVLLVIAAAGLCPRRRRSA